MPTYSWRIFRGSSMAHLGYSPDDMAAKHPGIIYVSLRGITHHGPSAERGALDPLAIPLTGIAYQEGTPDSPSHTLAPFGGLATASLARPSVAASIVTPAMMAVAPKACIKLSVSPKTRIETINTPTMWL